MIPGDNESLHERAKAFREWCEGFSQGLSMGGLNFDEVEEDEVQEAIQHIEEFAELDINGLEVCEEDERALMEVSEYTRMAILRIYGDLKQTHPQEKDKKKAH
jgi:uncharacterized protein